MTGRPVCVIGNANPDIVLGPLAEWPEPGTETFLERCDMRPGGSAANTALVLARLGARAGLVSATGSDGMGRWLAAHFTGQLDRVARLDHATGLSVGVLHPGAERSFLSFDGHLGALDLPLVLDALEDWPLQGALAMVSGGFALPALAPDMPALMTRLALAEAEIAIDPGWPDGGWTAESRAAFHRSACRARHVLLNDKELRGLTGIHDLEEAARNLLAELPPDAWVIAKRGARGALAFGPGGASEAATAPATSPFDTVGAGDAFNAGYLAELAAGGTMAAALARGTETASRVIADFPRGTAPLGDVQDARRTA